MSFKRSKSPKSMAAYKDTLLNFPLWEEEKYRTIIRSLSKFSGKEKAQLIHEAAWILAQQVPYIPICTQTLLYAKNSKLCGEAFNIGGGLDFRFSFLME